MAISDLCKQVVEKTDDALACGVIDLNSGMMMGVHNTVTYFTQDYLSAVAAASVEMARGKTYRRVEELLSKIRGEEVINTMEEVHLTTTHTYHFMKVVKDSLVVLITRKSTNPGMGWAAVRSVAADLEKAL